MSVQRRVAAWLMILSGVTHVAQLFVYETEIKVLGAAGFGVIYFTIGLLLLLWRSRVPLWLGAILPVIGGLAGVARFMTQPNPFSVWHVAIDVVVVSLCIYCLRRGA